MRLQRLKQLKTGIAASLYFKYGAVLLLVILSTLLVACSSSPPTNTNLGNPQVTVTINLGQTNASPTPPLPAYTCGAWVTNATPGYNTDAVVNVYAKFVQNINNNPVGVNNANGQATILWPGGGTSTVTATTTSDGLAIFPVSLKAAPYAVGKLVLVTVSFTSPDGHTCTVAQDQAAFFTPVIASPVASPTKNPKTGTPGTVVPVPTTPPGGLIPTSTPPH